jgi:hypothetical protein
VVVVAGSILDQSLLRAIRFAVPNSNNVLRDRLFDDRGPLSSFAAKIDLGHALGIT